jgi:uncharacterized delta-60 repeat protein
MKRTYHLLAAGLCLVAVLVAPTFAQAAPGDLDPLFGGDGKVTTDFGGIDDEILSMAIDSQGRVVVAGIAGPANDATLARYNPNGALDRFFGSDGTVTVDYGDGSAFAGADSVAIDSQGRIVVAGGSRGDVALARYKPDGSLDRSFGTDGAVTTDFGGGEFARSVAIDSEGRIVALGQRGSYRGWFVLSRYTPNGDIDPSFSGDGKAITGISDSARRARASSVAVDSRDRIVAAGYIETSATGDDFALVRYNADGIISGRSFGTNGKVITDFGANDSASSVAIDTQARILVAGDTDSNSDFALARYSPRGSLDGSFSGDGKVTTAIGGSADSLAFDSVGRIVLAGYKATGTGTEDRSVFALARYKPGGGLDGSFGTDGKVTTDFGGDTLDEAFSVRIDSVGRVVAAGAKSGDFALARYIG